MNQELCGCSLTRFRWSQFQSYLFSISTDCVTATLGTPEQRLRHNLSQDYHPTVRPVLTPNDIINITFSFRFSRIVSLVRESSSALTKINLFRSPFCDSSYSRNDGRARKVPKPGLEHANFLQPPWPLRVTAISFLLTILPLSKNYRSCTSISLKLKKKKKKTLGNWHWPTLWISMST